MTIIEDDLNAVRVIHEVLQPGERVVLIGKCRLQGRIEWFKFILLMLVSFVGCALSQNYLGLVPLILLAAPIFFFLSLYGRPFGFCALTDRRLIQWGDDGIVELALRSEVRRIEGTDSKINLIVATEKERASKNDRRLGRSKLVKRIQVTPLRRVAEIVGGKELLLDSATSVGEIG